MKYNIHVGDVFIAADGGKYGHIVIDTTTFASVDDIVTIPFTSDELRIDMIGNRIDAFKLAKVRYYKPKVIPKFVPNFNSKICS